MRRVLMVDGQPKGLEGLQRTLRQNYGWDVAVAPGGEAGLALMEASAFDVLVTGIDMPGMSGVTLLERVRDHHPQVVRIVLSSNAETDTRLRTVPLAHQSLSKPCEPAAVHIAVERACRLKDLLGDEAIRKLVGSMSDLPSLPRVYQALNEALADPEVSLDRVADLVEQDVAISAKVLQLVNSAFFGLAQPATSIRAAVSYLGLHTLKNLVLSVGVFSVFEPHRSLKAFSLEALQEHSQMTVKVVSRLPVPRHLAESAALAAMLHDVGKLILAWKLPDRFGAALYGAQDGNYPLHVVEEQLYGYSHAEIGAYLLGLWGLPYAVVEAVAYHHAPERIPNNKFDMVAAVYLANHLAHELESGGDGARAPTAGMNLDYLAEVGMADRLPALRESILEMGAAA